MAKQHLGRAAYDPRLNVYDSAEVRYWAREFGVSARRLLQAVEKAGTGLEALSNELRRESSRAGPIGGGSRG